jgi:ribosome biogenesis GTPase A
MPIQWFPGHMTKARRVLADSMPTQDVVSEALFASVTIATGRIEAIGTLPESGA